MPLRVQADRRQGSTYGCLNMLDISHHQTKSSDKKGSWSSIPAPPAANVLEPLAADAAAAAFSPLPFLQQLSLNKTLGPSHYQLPFRTH